MVVADLERTILNYLELEWGSFPIPGVVNEMELRLKSGGLKIREKILDEFGGYIISLYSDSKDSICLGRKG